MDVEDPLSVGERARKIRRRRGLSLEVVAGLAGITAQYLSMLECGLRGFNRRGLIEDLAEALGCSVADLTGQPYLAPDRQTVEVSAVLTDISVTLHDATLHDVPDVPARPLPELIAAARRAHAHVDDARYGAASHGLPALLTELHVHALTGSPEDRQTALAGLVETCQVAFTLAKRTGHAELAVAAAHRGCDAARLAERPDLLGMIATSRTIGLMRLGARWRAVSVSGETLTELAALPGPTLDDATVAEARGMLHLVSALGAARDGRPGDVATHLEEAGSLAAHTGERNHFRYHFGPSNVAAWALSIAVESGTGVEAAERFTAAPIDLSVFGSKARESFVLFDLARGWLQAEGVRDGEALRALDAADRIAPLQVRNDPIARDMVLTLDRRAPRRVWELDSLCNRFGIRSARSLKHCVEAGADLGRTLCRMIDIPETHRRKSELGRLTARGRSTGDGSWTTLLVVHELDGSWTVHGLGVGVTLPAVDMAALASAILGRGPVSAGGVDKWRDVDDIHIPDQYRVQQVGVAKLHGALPSRLHKRGRVVGRGFTRVHVQFDDEAEITSLRPHLVRVVDPTTVLGRVR